jgi:hypothetical protein
MLWFLKIVIENQYIVIVAKGIRHDIMRFLTPQFPDGGVCRSFSTQTLTFLKRAILPPKRVV